MYAHGMTKDKWEELREERREKRKKDEAPDDATHACLTCDHRTNIQTPHIRTENWCIDCDGWRMFMRLDKL